MEAKEILKVHVAKLASLTDEQFDYFFSFFKKQHFKKGQAIISEGDAINCEYFVISGCLKPFFINKIRRITQNRQHRGLDHLTSAVSQYQLWFGAGSLRFIFA